LIYIYWTVFFYRIGFWQDALLGETIIWIFGVGFALLINAGRTNEKDFFKKAILDNIKIVVIIEFLVNIYVFDLWAELILVPA